MILLGWEIGTGRRVEIPETGHLAWFGQTQLSGKTTALEAIAFRGGLKAVAFITKQGEGGFLTGRMIPPYFSEPTNDEEQPLWRWVKSILEASQQRKMNFEESWIIRACEDPRRAETLADVHANIKTLLSGEGQMVQKSKKKREWKYTRKPVSGMNAGVYTSLKAYFDIVMPQLARLPYSKKLVLGPGLNVMDLRGYASETQALVIRSVMEWVYQKERGVRVIVPEAQDFVPQGKNSPVKMACETLVRKAGANKNFMWLDSQDMAAVDKIMLRACSIVGIGVQTEGHEIDRSLGSLFTPELKPVNIARLKIGEFFVRTPEAKVSKVYVQPAWMESELHAQAIAKGEESVTSAKQMLTAFKKARPAPPQLLQVQIQELPDAEETENVGDVHSRNLRDGDAGARSGQDGALTGVRSGSPIGRDTNAALSDREFHGRTDEEIEKNPSSPQILNQQEPGKHEQPEEVALPRDRRSLPGDPGVEGNAADFEGLLENGRFTRTVPGTSVRSTDGPSKLRASQDSTGSEGAMPQTKTPVEILTQYLLGARLGGGEFDQALRDLLKEHAALIDAHDALAKRLEKLSLISDEQFEDRLRRQAVTGHGPQATGHEAVPSGNGHGLRFTVPDLEYIWKFIKGRADKEGLAELLTRRPELRVKVERTPVTMDDSNLQGRIARLLHEGFFKTPRNGPAVQKELKRRTGTEQPTTNLYKPLNKLTEMGFLTVEQDGYQEVAEMKVLVTK